MAYVAVSGGKEAIEESIKLLDYYRSGSKKDIELEAIENKLSLLVDRVISEAGLYSKSYAALALKQCEGCVEEAVFLLRAYRSTLTRDYYTTITDTKDMRVVRRISAAFKDIKGGQILGATYDYTHRLINFDIEKENAEELYNKEKNELLTQIPEKINPCQRVSYELKEEGLIDNFEKDDTKPYDITENMLEFPARRSAKLQTLSRADTGFISGLAYSALRGFGQLHPTVGELRAGYVEICVPYLFDENESIYIGEFMVTEVECFNQAEDKDQLKLAVGYGAVFGRNENKAIAMAVIDRELECGGEYPTQNEEFVLMHGDSLEMNGFISHLKLRMNYSSASNIAEKIIAAGSRNAGKMTERAEELLKEVEILTSRMSEAPKNFSGGMQQRVQISKALANNPSILLLDEVTTGLDLSVQAKVLDLIRKIKSRFGISILLVSHDLAVIRMLADRTIVMLDGKIIESGLTDQVLEDPQHAYTQQLVHSLI